MIDDPDNAAEIHPLPLANGEREGVEVSAALSGSSITAPPGQPNPTFKVTTQVAIFLDTRQQLIFAQRRKGAGKSK